MKFESSHSENNGIEQLTKNDLKVYSVGISTGGMAEMRMAMENPKRLIIATTIDSSGATFAESQIAQRGLSPQIKVKIEDVTKPIPYVDQYFDYIYARLVLHYLPKKDLQKALSELHRILKMGGKFFIVVRSVDCVEAKDKSSKWDPETGLTTYISNGNSYSRYFHSEDSIKNYLTSTGFSIKYTKSYQEQLCVDFQRKIPSKQIDSLIEIFAVK